MQLISALVALSVVLAGSIVTASSNFGLTCTDIHLAGSGTGLDIAAICENEGGGNNGVQVLGLSTCLGNNNGEFQCQFNGNAMQTCNSCSLSGTTLTCTCFRLNGGTDRASIDLNSCIGNNDGVMVCP